MFKEVDLRLSHSNLSCCRAPVGFEPTKAAGKHTSLGRHSQEHATTLARLQHTQKKRKQDRKDKGTAENTGRVRENREGNTTNNIKRKTKGTDSRGSRTTLASLNLKVCLYGTSY